MTETKPLHKQLEAIRIMQIAQANDELQKADARHAQRKALLERILKPQRQ
ncbi:MAG: hypothetical protein J5I92_12360 [Thiogranum sp.]|nr:hypothetical protein [Thiogranum sp.]